MVNNLLASLKQNVDKVNLIHTLKFWKGIKPHLPESFHKQKTGNVDFC